MVFGNVHQLTELTDVEWVNMNEKSIVHFNREESVPAVKCIFPSFDPVQVGELFTVTPQIENL